MAKGMAGNCFPLFCLYWGMKRLITIMLVLAACKGEEPKPSHKLVPEALYEQPLNQFYVEAEERGRTLTRIEPEVRFVTGGEMNTACSSTEVGEKTSNSFKEGDKYIIEITDNYSDEANDSRFYAPIFRELTHLLLNKPYATGPRVLDTSPTFENIMWPCYSSRNQMTDQQLDHLFQ